VLHAAVLLWAIQCIGAIVGDAAAFSAGARVGFAVGKVSDLGNRIDSFGASKRGVSVRESTGFPRAPPLGARLNNLPAARCLIRHEPGALRASTASAPSTTATDGVGVEEAPWMDRLMAESERLDRRLYQVLHTNRWVDHCGTQISFIFRGRDGVCCSQSPHRCGFSPDEAKHKHSPPFFFCSAPRPGTLRKRLEAHRESRRGNHSPCRSHDPFLCPSSFAPMCFIILPPNICCKPALTNLWKADSVIDGLPVHGMAPGARTISSPSHGHESLTKSGTKSWLTLPWPNALCVQIDYGEMVEQGDGGKEAMRLVESMRRNGYAVVRLPEADADLMKSTWEAARGFGWKPFPRPRFPS
jgi:hypothetical protein